MAVLEFRRQPVQLDAKNWRRNLRFVSFPQNARHLFSQRQMPKWPSDLHNCVRPNLRSNRRHATGQRERRIADALSCADRRQRNKNMPDAGSRERETLICFFSFKKTRRTRRSYRKHKDNTRQLPDSNRSSILHLSTIESVQKSAVLRTAQKTKQERWNRNQLLLGFATHAKWNACHKRNSDIPSRETKKKWLNSTAPRVIIKTLQHDHLKKASIKFDKIKVVWTPLDSELLKKIRRDLHRNAESKTKEQMRNFPKRTALQ